METAERNINSEFKKLSVKAFAHWEQDFGATEYLASFDAEAKVLSPPEKTSDPQYEILLKNIEWKTADGKMVDVDDFLRVKFKKLMEDAVKLEADTA